MQITQFRFACASWAEQEEMIGRDRQNLIGDEDVFFADPIETLGCTEGRNVFTWGFMRQALLFIPVYSGAFWGGESGVFR
jgi:hypothetical protein